MRGVTTWKDGTMSAFQKIRGVIARIVAVFLASGLSVIGAGSLAGIEIWQAAMIAGIGGVATVVEGLSRAFLADGNLSEDEINAVFAGADAEIEAKKAK
jgi:hypothetical protein